MRRPGGRKWGATPNDDELSAVLDFLEQCTAEMPTAALFIKQRIGERLCFVKTLSSNGFWKWCIVLICVALCWLLYTTGTFRMVVLHLFYLPVVLAAFFLRRYRAGVLALLCAIRRCPWSSPWM